MDSIVNPPWLKSMRRIEKQMRSAASIIEQSDVIGTVRSLNEYTRLASLAFQESEGMRSISSLAESSQLSILSLQESDVMKPLNELAELIQLSSTHFQQSEVVKQIKSLTETSQHASIALQQSEAFKSISQITELASFQALANLDNSPLYDDLNLAFASQLSAGDFIDDTLHEIDAQISKEISSQTDFNDLSDNAKSILLYLFHNCFLPLLISCLGTYMMANWIEAKKELESVNSTQEVKQFVRTHNDKFDRSSLIGFRVTTVKSLNFRESPSMKSEIITTLPIGSLIEVIDKSNRSWLLVEVEINGVIEQGWVSRRYTTYFK